MENELKEGTTITIDNKNQLFFGDVLLYSDGWDCIEVEVILVSDSGLFFWKKMDGFSKKRLFVDDRSLSKFVFVKRGKQYKNSIKEKLFDDAKEKYETFNNGFLSKLFNDIKKLFGL